MNCASLYWFSDAEHENGYEESCWATVSKKNEQTYVIPALHTISMTLFTDWLALIKCTASSPAIYT